MSGSDGQGDLAPRFAWAFATAFLCLILPASLAYAAYRPGPAGVAVATALFVLPLLYTVPRTRAVWDRHRGWLLAIQAVGTYLPFAVFGRDWAVGLSGLLGGLLLLTLPAPASWMRFAGAVAVEGMLRIVLPLPDASFALTVWLILTVPVNIALPLFGLVRLADLVTDVYAARIELAALAVTQQRLRAASRLRQAIGDRLEAITGHAKAALPLLARSPELARGQLNKATGIARQALDQARRVTADNDRDHSSPQTGPTGEAVAPRLARLVLVVALSVYTAWLLLNVVASSASATTTAGVVAAVITVLALQLHHTLACREGVSPRGWPLTLAAQTLLSLASFHVFDDVDMLALAGFPAGSALLLLPGRWAWAGFVAIPASVAFLAAYSPYGVYGAANLGGITAAYGLMGYGLSRLTDLARRLEAAREELVRMAVVQERLRLSRDTHDLLGLGLSAIALKGDLVGQLIGRDDAKAHDELEQLLEVAAKASGDVLSVTSDAHRRLSLRTELTAACDTLAAAGIQIHAEVPAVMVPAAVEVVLATVLREAATNVLRHAAATQCIIELSPTQEAVRLRVANDGVRSPEAISTGGAGIGNLRARVQALGGHLSAGPDREGRFELAVEIPVTP